MKAILLALGALVLASCSLSSNALLEPEPVAAQKSNANRARISWLSELQPSKETTPFQVEIHSITGEQLTTLAQVRPNSDYTLVIKSEKPSRFTLKTTSGFTAPLQSQSLHRLSAATEFEIPIHTDTELSTPLYVSIVPVHVQGRSFTKEKPKSFLLLNQ